MRGASGNNSLNCTLTLTAGSAKGQSTMVTVAPTDPDGTAVQQTLRVTINGRGGGSLSWLLLAFLADLSGLTWLRQRRHHEGI